MSTSSDQSDPNNEANSTQGKDSRWHNSWTTVHDRLRPLFHWICASFGNPDNLPLHATAVFTFSLAVFAYYAWEESARGTAALQGQLNELRRQSALTISQLRPKLSLEFKGPKVPMKLGDKEGWVITPTWENRGGSEGINYWGWDNARLFTPDAPTDFDFLTLGRDASGTPRTTIAINEPRLQISQVISRDEVKSVVGDKGTFVLWGYVEYQESLPGNQPHHIHWCYKVIPVDAGDSYIFSYPLYRKECNSSD